MKFRVDFVTNSSSSQFMIYKKDVDNKPIKNVISDSLKLANEVKDFVVSKGYKNVELNPSAKLKKIFYGPSFATGQNSLPLFNRKCKPIGKPRSFYYGICDCAIITPKLIGVANTAIIMRWVCGSPREVWNICTNCFNMDWNKDVYLSSDRDYDKKWKEERKKVLAWDAKIIKTYERMWPQFKEKKNDRDYERHYCEACIACKNDRFQPKCVNRTYGITSLQQAMNSDVAIFTGENYFDGETMDELIKKFNINIMCKHMG